MNTQNMKLLDLETGKYLELGKDFYYGGDSVYLIERLEGCLKSHNKWLVSLTDTALKYAHKPNQRNMSYEIAQKVVDNHAKTENTVVNSQIQSGAIIKSKPPTELKEICEKVGAVVYDGRYVLLTKDYNVKAGDLWNSSKYYNVLLACINYKNNIHFKHNISGGSVPFFEFIRDDNNDNLIVRCSQNEDSIFLGNIFEEYSKKLRNEPNKFEELKAFLK